MKSLICFILFAFLLCDSFAQSFNPITGNSELKGRVRFTKLKNTSDSILSTDANGELKLVEAPFSYMKAGDGIYTTLIGDTLVWNALGFTITNITDTGFTIVKGDTSLVLAFSGSGGGAGLTYPYTVNKYLNGYGNFATLNTDSIAQGATNKFSKWDSVSGGINYDIGNVGIFKNSPSYPLDVNGTINGNSYKIQTLPAIDYDNSTTSWAIAGSGGISAANNLAIGGSAMSSTTGNAGYNVSIGFEALKNALNNYPSGPIESGSQNVSIGYQASKNNSEGYNNTSIGFKALSGTGLNPYPVSDNTAVGAYAMNSGTGASFSTAIGSYALYSHPSSLSIAIGYGAMRDASGDINIAIGSESLYNVTGSNNVAIGNSALRYITTGVGNTMIGSAYGPQLASSYNTIIGVYDDTASINNNVIIADGQGAIVLRSNQNHVTSLYHGANVASASTITATGNSFHVTGTTGITSISGSLLTAGATITIIFDGALTLTDGSNLKLAGNFTTTADDTITLKFDGTNFYELSRSIN